VAHWWIDEPVVAGSANPTDEALADLRADGFAVIVSLLDERTQRPRYDVARLAAAGWARHSLPVVDYHAPTIDQLRQFVALARLATKEARVLVHCEAGVGRTGTMAAAYWIQRGFGVDEAVTRVRRAKPTAVETAAQMVALGDFAKLVHG
jgi:atypical dual specificity phosphatase